MKSKNRIFAFRICAGAVLNAMAATTAFMALALMLYNLTEKLNVPYSKLSLTYTFAYAGMLIASLFGGKLITKCGGRTAPVISTCTVVLVVLALTFSNSLILIYIAALFYGFGQVLTFFYLNTMVVSWVGLGQSTVLGIGQCFMTLGSAILSPILASVINGRGLTSAGILLGSIIAGVMVISTAFLCGELPEKYGMTSIDFGAKKSGATSGVGYEIYQASMPSSRALRTPVFLAVAILGFLISMGTNVYTANQYPLLEYFGVDMVTASKLVSLGLICNAAGSVIIGWLNTKLGIRKGFLIPAVGVTVMFFVGFLIGGILGAVIIACSDICFTYSKIRQGVMFNSLFGNKVSPDLIAWDGIFVCIASMVAGPLAAYIAEELGSYQQVGFVATGIFAVCVLIVLYITSDKTREYVKKIDEPYREQNA